MASERERSKKAQERSQDVDDRLKKLNDQLLTLREGMGKARACFCCRTHLRVCSWCVLCVSYSPVHNVPMVF